MHLLNTMKRKKLSSVLVIAVTLITVNGLTFAEEKEFKLSLETVDDFNETTDSPDPRPKDFSQRAPSVQKGQRALAALSYQDSEERIVNKNAEPRKIMIRSDSELDIPIVKKSVKNRFRIEGGDNEVKPIANPVEGDNREIFKAVDGSLGAQFAGFNQKKDGWEGGQERRENPPTYRMSEQGDRYGRGGGSYEFEYRRNSSKKVTAKPRVDQAAKSDVRWFDDTQYYGLRASADERFKIRSAPPPLQVSPWPMPRLYQPSNVTFRINARLFELHVVGEPCDELIEINFKTRIVPNTFGILPDNESSHLDRTGGVRHEGEELRTMAKRLHRVEETWRGGWEGGWGDGVVDIHTMNVTVLKECTKYPSLEMDESYDLEVKRSGVSVITREVWGALRAMETFSQLVYQDELGQFWINKTYIHDYPRFKHRGVLLDTSRHYLNKKTILANLEAMAQNKMNVFHWHIVDDQSFPFQSKVFPDVTRLGAYDARTHIYTHEDIAEIIEEARVRGIRVIPEFDSPGHTFSWGYGQDHLLTPCYNYKREPNGLFGPINPILKKTYKFLRSLFDEVTSVFKDRYVHIGGDEVPFDCWQSNPYLQNFMMRNNISDIRNLLSLYGKELMKIVSEVGSKKHGEVGFIAWQEMFDNGVRMKPDTIVQIWSGDSYDIDRVTRAGLRAIFSSCWYLDYINYGQDWDKYYRCEQIGSQLDEYHVHNLSLLIGGEACLWTEYADDEGIMPRLWPRASAAAERLWSDKYLDDVHQAAPRIEEQRCRMIRRGLQVGVLSGPGYCKKFIKPGGGRELSDWRDAREPRKPDKKLRGEWRQGGRREARKGGRQEEGGERVVRRRGLDADYPDSQEDIEVKTDSYLIPGVVILLFSVTVVAVLLLSREGTRGYFVSVICTSSATRRRRLVALFITLVAAWGLWTIPFWFHSASHVLTSTKLEYEGWT